MLGILTLNNFSIGQNDYSLTRPLVIQELSLKFSAIIELVFPHSIHLVVCEMALVLPVIFIVYDFSLSLFQPLFETALVSVVF